MKHSQLKQLIKEEIKNILAEDKEFNPYHKAGEMISQVGLFTRELADKLEAENSGNLSRFYSRLDLTPEEIEAEKEELIRISEAYPAYLAKVKATMEELINDPMYQVAVGDIGGTIRDKGVGTTLEKAYMRSKSKNP